MKTFEGLKDGTVITNPIDGNMIIRYSDWFSEDGEKEMCLEGADCLFAGWQFDPSDWEIAEET